MVAIPAHTRYVLKTRPEVWLLLNGLLSKIVVPHAEIPDWLRGHGAGHDDLGEFLHHSLASRDRHSDVYCTPLGRHTVMEIIRPGWKLLDALHAQDKAVPMRQLLPVTTYLLIEHLLAGGLIRPAGQAGGLYRGASVNDMPAHVRFQVTGRGLDFCSAVQAAQAAVAR